MDVPVKKVFDEIKHIPDNKKIKTATGFHYNPAGGQRQNQRKFWLRVWLFTSCRRLPAASICISRLSVIY